MNILQRIFTDYYEEIKYTLHPRDSEMENIDKMLNCGDPSFGGAMYVCTTCHNMKFVPFRCKSRFCPTCGVKYSQERSTSMAFKLVNCTHRHCVFTIDEKLRHFFLEDRSLLNCLFRAVQSVILHMFNKINKSQNFVPGFICVLHTFGRPLEWNPHIHCILSESGIHKSKHRFIKSFTKWRQDILLSFGYDPLFCPHCKKEMALVEVYYRHKWVSLQELYERTMAKVKCRSA